MRNRLLSHADGLICARSFQTIQHTDYLPDRSCGSRGIVDMICLYFLQACGSFNRKSAAPAMPGPIIAGAGSSRDVFESGITSVGEFEI